MQARVEQPPKLAPDPERMFRQGEAFLEAMTVLLRHTRPENQAQLGAPIVINSAFASEVFLKCLIRIESGQTPKGHQLDKLFSSLAPATRVEVERLWNEAAARKEATTRRIEVAMGIAITRDLQGALIEGSRAFERTRYTYEGDGRFRFMLADLPKMLHEVILRRRPKWSMPLPEPKLIEDMQFQKPPA